MFTFSEGGVMRAIAMTDYDSGVALQELPTPLPNALTDDVAGTPPERAT